MLPSEHLGQVRRRLEGWVGRWGVGEHTKLSYRLDLTEPSVNHQLHTILDQQTRLSPSSRIPPLPPSPPVLWSILPSYPEVSPACLLIRCLPSHQP